jgi:hypothetical protein
VKKVKGFKHGKELKRRKRIKEEQGKGLATWKSKEQGGSLAGIKVCGELARRIYI